MEKKLNNQIIADELLMYWCCKFTIILYLHNYSNIQDIKNAIKTSFLY